MDRMNKILIARLLGYDITYDEIEDCVQLYGYIDNLESLLVIDIIDEIGDWAFAGNVNLVEIIISYKLKKIGHCAFLNCKNLKKISYKDENGKVTDFDDLDEFYSVFSGEVKSGAFENCFGSSILVNKNIGDKDDIQIQFEKALNPFPSEKDQNKEVFLKILSNNDDGMLHISLINYQMIIYDLQYFDVEALNNEGIYYRPYFYEFFISIKEIKYSEYVLNHLDTWLVGSLSYSENVKSSENIFVGEVFFSASPFSFRNIKLVILDKSAPTEVIGQIKKIYELKNANKVNQGNKTCLLKPIVKSIVDGANATTIKVYNVGQAACNYIYLDNNKRIMFDIGYSYRKKDYTDIYIHKNKFVFENCKPYLIILSHWDLDHILGVAYSKDVIFEVPWIAPSMENLQNGQYSVSAARLAKYLSWKNKLYLIEEDLNGENVFDSDSFQIWKGKGKDNAKRLKKNGKIVTVNGIEISGLNKANNIGLIIRLKTNNNTMLLPGDCEYEMMPKKVYNHSIRYENMIIPHHGSRMALIRCKRKTKIRGKKGNAIISAGYNTYKPEHPWKIHIKFLKRLRYDIHKTSRDCKRGYLIKVDLRTNTIS